MSSNTNFLKGRIIKGVGGFYYIDTPNGVFECRARGRFRKEGTTPLVGDIVSCNIDSASNTGMITEIFPRQNALIRPAVANVTSIAIVVSITNPKPNLRTIDKLISSAEYVGIRPIICINKIDLCSSDELFEIYSKSGFNVLSVSAATKFNISRLEEMLDNEITVFAGNSGVGKSSLLNCILQDVVLKTGEVSSKIERGRHTTRHTELIKLKNSDGYIIDTPGFSSFDLTGFDVKRLDSLFPEFSYYIGKCRFMDCCHTVEDGCAVLQAVHDGIIPKSRHDSYLEQLNEINNNTKY